jgi:hypothetical protein
MMTASCSSTRGALNQTAASIPISLMAKWFSVSATAKPVSQCRGGAHNSPSSPLLHSGLGSAGYIVVSAGLTIIPETPSSCPATLGPVSVKEANMTVSERSSLSL